jgi:hypothetical protein
MNHVRTWTVSKDNDARKVSVTISGRLATSTEENEQVKAEMAQISYKQTVFLSKCLVMQRRPDMDGDMVQDMSTRTRHATAQLKQKLESRSLDSMLLKLNYMKTMHKMMVEGASEMARKMQDQPDAQRAYEEAATDFKESYKTYFCYMTKMDPSEYMDYFLMG